jgi:hypothetical protein
MLLFKQRAAQKIIKRMRQNRRSLRRLLRYFIEFMSERQTVEPKRRSF